MNSWNYKQNIEICCYFAVHVSIRTRSDFYTFGEVIFKENFGRFTEKTSPAAIKHVNI
jgi:hypothetical protein